MARPAYAGIASDTVIMHATTTMVIVRMIFSRPVVEPRVLHQRPICEINKSEAKYSLGMKTTIALVIRPALSRCRPLTPSHLYHEPLRERPRGCEEGGPIDFCFWHKAHISRLSPNVRFQK